MFFFDSMFWMVLGMGLAVPSTITLFINMAIKIKLGDEYQFSLKSLFMVYLIALVGWAIFLAEVM